MNRDLILQSDLLDIIFDNRNKNYGAYVLRKTYTTRIFVSLLFTLIFSAFISLWVLTEKGKAALQKVVAYRAIPGNVLQQYHRMAASKQPEVKKHRPIKGISVNAPIFKPKIVSDLKINNSPPALSALQASIPVDAQPGGASTDSLVGGPGSNGSGNAVGLGVLKKTATPKVLEFADVMPEFPGGMKALMKYLRRNIHAPQDLDAGQEVSVKIKFIVNFAGKLEDFQVLQSGGAPYDNEVLRVLRNMPSWIPGSNHGQKVAVYYEIPVRFTSGF